MPFPNCIGHTRFWTKEKVLERLQSAMREIQGPLPCCDSTYNKLKKGRLDWPGTSRILGYFHSMARAWMAAGAPMSRVTLHNQDWTPEEEHYLLENAGILTLPKIAAHLNRSRGACRARLSKTFEITARDNHGYLSASQLAKEFNCPCHRIRKALKAGKIKGFFDPVRNRWNVDLTSLTAGALEILTKPKDTWTNHVTDVGDYYSRHGLIRKVIGGKTIRVKEYSHA